MTTVTVGRIDAHAVTQGVASGRVLADRLTTLVARAADALDGELAGIDDRELVCIRRLDIACGLGDATTDHGTAAAWGRTLGRAIAGVVDASSEPTVSGGRVRHDVVRYPDLTAALADLVAGLALGDQNRAWAWTMAGLLETTARTWPGAGPGDLHDVRVPGLASRDGARAAALDALSRNPASAAAAVVSAICRVGLAAVHRLLGSDGWRLLAAVVLADAGSDGSVLVLGLDDSAPGQQTRRRAVPGLVHTRLADAAAQSGLVVPAPTALSWAVVALADVRPDLLTAADAPDLLTSLANDLARLAATGHAAPTDALSEGPFAPASGTATPAGTAAEPSGDTGESGDAGREPGLPTSRAGLLFLLSVAAEAGLPALALDDPRLVAEDRGWVLGHLGTRLAGTEMDDPAVRVFAGLSVEGPFTALIPGDSEQEAALDEAVAAWTTAAAHRLRAHTSGLPMDDRVLLRRVVLREGAVHAEPGWVEIALPLSEIDVDVRRAGLDLDPGFVPWLGTVVRFRYE